MTKLQDVLNIISFKGYKYRRKSELHHSLTDSSQHLYKYYRSTFTSYLLYIMKYAMDYVGKSTFTFLMQSINYPILPLTCLCGTLPKYPNN